MSSIDQQQEMTQAETAAFFGRELLGWYDVVKRKLPWRINRDPYRVWVSEIMLQQTRVDTVIPYYERFMQRFPTVQALAEAPEEDVLKHWEGLGYYSRARNLQAGAREVVERYRGIVPDDAASVASLKGVGPYTAGAIMSIAFNRPEPAVDGNVMRVLSRFWLLEDDIAKPATRVKIEKLARSIIPEGRAGDFNQALMELGALVCTPKSPGCLTCPVMEHCAGRLAGREAELPIKTKAKPPRPEWRLGVVVEGSGEHAGRVLVRQRPDTGLLARMWELPHVLVPKDAEKRLRSGSKGAGGKEEAASEQEQASLADQLARMLHEEAGLLIRPLRHWTKAEHVFSHIHWHMDVFEADMPSHVSEASSAAPSDSGSAELGLVAETNGSYAGGGGELPAGYAWIGPEAMDTLAFPNLFLKLLQQHWGIKGRG
ncbi:A/G-specific DNA-adenine glycosylase [Paenibacillus cellulosilyticus]|uniref:Adenine DNA glycosylase n=1 Tax=Paenibacillus cellulosilyticus TaxID=375489 RepID=A0A2V2YRT8_9BACL|nr:A/G-specific adenine glycosylase [Paenibacillus cellulosilyticus]PWV97302.1 A/G-specific DNA-adenine glycosylase [Paenibacillus cellulosilyticus]QKS47496.1 A/G-specific adenine glycosylase [Paenibacillus cellulosilyticus]